MAEIFKQMGANVETQSRVGPARKEREKSETAAGQKNDSKAHKMKPECHATLQSGQAGNSRIWS